MKFRSILYYWIVVCLFSSCGALERCPKGDVCDIQFYNHSNANLAVAYSTKLPDTSITDANVDILLSRVPPGQNDQIPSNGWKYTINKLCPSGKVMFVLLDGDTINKYGINYVVANYRIVKRYELSIDSLEKLNWTIVYP